MFFSFVSQFHKVRGDLKRFKTVFTNEMVIKFVLNKINDLAQYKINYHVIFCCFFELTGWDVCFIVTLTLYLVP